MEKARIVVEEGCERGLGGRFADVRKEWTDLCKGCYVGHGRMGLGRDG